MSFFTEREIALHSGTFTASFLIMIALLFKVRYQVVTIFAVLGIWLSTVCLTKLKPKEACAIVSGEKEEI